MNHSFNVEVATKYGIPHALVLGHIDFMVQKARTNGEKRIEGKYWMRKSVGEFAEMYPYLTKNQVRRAIEKLRNDGLIVSRRFKSNECTKTLWYTVTKEGRKLLGDDKTQAAPEPQRSGTSATPIRQESSFFIKLKNTPSSAILYYLLSGVFFFLVKAAGDLYSA